MNPRRNKGRHYPFRPVSDIRDLILTSAEMYPDRPAFLTKKDIREPYQPVTYRQLAQDMEAPGTAFLNLGLAGKKIAAVYSPKAEAPIRRAITGARIGENAVAENQTSGVIAGGRSRGWITNNMKR